MVITITYYWLYGVRQWRIMCVATMTMCSHVTMVSVYPTAGAVTLVTTVRIWTMKLIVVRLAIINENVTIITTKADGRRPRNGALISGT